jgi:DNA repair protein RadC
MSILAEAEHARAEQLDNPESIYRACADMKLFNQEVLRVVLLDTRCRHISTVEITKGSINFSAGSQPIGLCFRARAQPMCSYP